MLDNYQGYYGPPPPPPPPRGGGKKDFFYWLFIFSHNYCKYFLYTQRIYRHYFWKCLSFIFWLHHWKLFFSRIYFFLENFPWNTFLSFHYSHIRINSLLFLST